jgi:predicted nucleotidyltransferase component of viral defense system
MNIELVERIKRLIIIALASDDDLIESIVLKGGNAIDLLYKAHKKSFSRTSYDLDFSIQDGDFDQNLQIDNRIYRTLEQTFAENDLVLFDYKFLAKPKLVNESMKDFWGGYKVTFKVVSKAIFEAKSGNLLALRNAAIAVRPDHSPTFELEFSKFEYTEKRIQTKVDGYSIFVYTPEMIVFEKLRALCQQLPQYAAVVPSFNPRPRARDFYDIHLIVSDLAIDPSTNENLKLIEDIFLAKRVPLDYIRDLAGHKHIHSDNWESVKDTLSSASRVESYDFYFDFVINKFAHLAFPSFASD